MKLHYLTIPAALTLVLLSGCNRSSYTSDDIDTQAMINYQPPPMPYPQDEPRASPRYANNDSAGNLEEPYNSNQAKPAVSSTPEVKSTFGTTAE